MRTLLALVIFAATVAYVLGVTQPLIEVKRLWLLADRPSLVQMVASLWRGGEMLLATIVGLFSIAAPAAKLGLLHVAAAEGDHGRLPGWFRALAGWSMLDVLLVALVIFAAKTSGLADAVTLPGLWFFAASVLMTAAASALAKKALV